MEQPLQPPVATAPETAVAPATADVIEVWQEPTPSVAVEVNPRTGEPRRPALIWASTIAGLSAVAVMVATLLWSYWNAVTAFSGAAWLFGLVSAPKPGIQVALVAGVTVVTVVAAAAAAITAYYGWWGYAWTRISAIVSALTSGLMLLLNPVGWAAIGLTIIAGALLWLPPAARFFAEWRQVRHPEISFGAPVTSVHYGPLPKYRRS